MNRNLLLPPVMAMTFIASGVHAQQTSVKQLETVVVTGSPIIDSNNVDSFSSFSTRVRNPS